VDGSADAAADGAVDAAARRAPSREGDLSARVDDMTLLLDRVNLTR
jgi:hypothetical protein